MKEFMITKSSIVEIQNLFVDPKSWHVKSNSEQYFYLSTFPAKINGKIFQIKEKTLFWGHFCTKGNFPKSSGHVQLQGFLSI